MSGEEDNETRGSSIRGREALIASGALIPVHRAKNLRGRGAEAASDRGGTSTDILLEMRDDDRGACRRLAIETTAGSLTGTFDPGYLDDLRQDWPE